MMKFTTHLAVVLLFIAMVTMLGGCGSRGPIAPELGSSDENPTASKPFEEDRAAWQSVELVPCDPGGIIVGETGISGLLRYHVSPELVFRGQVQLHLDSPNREYLLSIAGKADLPGRSEEYAIAGAVFYDYDAPVPYTGLPTLAGGIRGAEKYCDFALVTSDQYGSVDLNFAIHLPAGEYDVEFQVKDAHIWCQYAQTGSFDTRILYNDQVNFKITDQLLDKAH
jgi:predicted small lipoprotein YifL